MSIWFITIILFTAMFIGMAFGVRLAFLLGGLAVAFVIFLWGSHALGVILSSVYGILSSLTLVCLPLFIFMAMVLQESGVAEDLYKMMHNWMGPLKGGLSMGTVVICTAFAAMSGVAAAATTSMGLIALPEMLKRNYDKSMSMGCIMAGGALGSIIPPSLVMVLYAVIAGESLGKLLVAGIIPGLILSSLYVTYIAVRCNLQPKMGPAQPINERVDFKEKVNSLKGVFLPLLIITGVLGTIFTGVATPTEAAAVGALGSIVAAAIHRKLNWQMLKAACYRSFSLNAMIIWIFLGASCFSTVYTALGATEFIKQVIATLPVNPWIIIIGMQFTFFLLGMVMDDIAIIMITAPVYIPIIKILGFDTLWFGILYVINTEMAMLTPPFGYSLFYMRAVTPEDISMADIYRAGLPFLILQAIGIALLMKFSQLALWLPGIMIKPG